MGTSKQSGRWTDQQIWLRQHEETFVHTPPFAEQIAQFLEKSTRGPTRSCRSKQPDLPTEAVRDQDQVQDQEQEQDEGLLPFGVLIQVDYLHVARAALSCGAFCSALMYAEWWCELAPAGLEGPSRALESTFCGSECAQRADCTRSPGPATDLSVSTGQGGTSPGSLRVRFRRRMSVEEWVGRRGELRAVLLRVYRALGQPDSVHALNVLSGAESFSVHGASGELGSCSARIHISRSVEEGRVVDMAAVINTYSC